MTSAANLAVAAIGKEFGAGALALSWVVTIYLLATAAALLPCGRLADLRGRERVFLLGLAAHSVFSFAGALAPSMAFLIVVRALQGVGGAMIFSTVAAILTGATPAEERGRALGINTAAVYAGLSVGPLLGGVITQHLGWRWVFAASGLLGLAVWAVALRVLKTRKEAAAGGFDVWGAVTSVVGISATLYGASNLTGAAFNRWVLLGGLAVLAGFYLWERRFPSPLLEVQLFRRNPGLAFSNLAALINYSATFATSYLLSLYLQLVRGLAPQAAGLVLLAQPVAQTVVSPAAGRLSDRLEPRVVASVGMAVSSFGLALLAGLGQRSSPHFVFGTLALLGLGFGLFSSPNTNAIMSSVNKSYYGIASSVLALMRLVGQALSMAAASFIFGYYLGNHPLSAASAPLLLKSVRTAFLLYASLSAAGILASLARGRIHPEGERRVTA
jgi:EmrB/QacA subfamily drug resistance transporter